LDKRRHARTDKAGQKEQKVVVFWERLGFGQKTGLVAAVGVFIAGQIALNLTLASKAYVDTQARETYAQAILSATASRASGLIASGDMLTVTSELNRLIASDVVFGAAVTDVESQLVASVGLFDEDHFFYSTPLKIGPDLAGTLSISLGDIGSTTSLSWTISGLNAVLAVSIYALFGSLSRQQQHRLRVMLNRVSNVDLSTGSTDPMGQLEKALDALPLDTMMSSEDDSLDESAVQSMAVTTLSLDHIGRYLDTLDENALVHYVGIYETLLKTVGQLLKGDLQSSRPQSLSLFFEGRHNGVSPEARAAISAVLLQHLLVVAERSQRLKFVGGIGIGRSDLSRGEQKSAYAALYTQSVIDETLHAAQRAGSLVKVSRSLQDHEDVCALFELIETADGDTHLGTPSVDVIAELDKQSKLLQRRLFPDVGEQTDLPF
jgi:hypothetical protein